MRVRRVAAWLVVMLLLAASPGMAAPILYAGLGGHSNGDSTNDGALAKVDGATGVVTIIGHPAGVSRISGLTFSGDKLYASTQAAGGFPPPPGPTSFSNLIQLNPATGALLSSVPIIDPLEGGLGISIADLATQPVTGTLFGIRGPTDQRGGFGKLYTINPTTGVATLLGNTGNFFGSIAFGPNGTLLMSGQDLDFATGQQVNPVLKVLNPLNAATIVGVPAQAFYGALGITNEGIIYAGTGDQSGLYTLNPITGAPTFVGGTGRNFIGDLATQPVPEPATLTLLGLGLLGVGTRRWRR